MANDMEIYEDMRAFAECLTRARDALTDREDLDRIQPDTNFSEIHATVRKLLDGAEQNIGAALLALGFSDL